MIRAKTRIKHNSRRELSQVRNTYFRINPGTKVMRRKSDDWQEEVTSGFILFNKPVWSNEGNTTIRVRHEDGDVVVERRLVVKVIDRVTIHRGQPEHAPAPQPVPNQNPNGLRTSERKHLGSMLKTYPKDQYPYLYAPTRPDSTPTEQRKCTGCGLCPQRDHDTCRRCRRNYCKTCDNLAKIGREQCGPCVAKGK